MLDFPVLLRHFTNIITSLIVIGQVATTEVAKMVSRAWKALSASEREPWIQMGIRDRARFELEKANYTGPWKAVRSEKVKDPQAPKRPLSSFFDFSNKYRKTVQDENPGMKAAEVTSVLAKMWKSAPEEERAFFLERYIRRREKYKATVAEYKKKKDRDRKRREEIATAQAEDLAALDHPSSHIFRSVSFDLDGDLAWIDQKRSKEITSTHANNNFAALDQASQDHARSVSLEADQDLDDLMSIDSSIDQIDWEPIPFIPGNAPMETICPLELYAGVLPEKETEMRQLSLLPLPNAADRRLIPTAAASFPQGNITQQKRSNLRWAHSAPF